MRTSVNDALLLRIDLMKLKIMILIDSIDETSRIWQKGVV